MLFRLWSFINNVLVGKILKGKEDGLSDDEAEDRAINELVRVLEGVKFDGFEVHPIGVPCDISENDVVIDGKTVFNNSFTEEEAKLVHKIMKDKSMTRKKLLNDNPEVAETLKIIFKHIQVTLHGFAIRKCKKGKIQGPVCKYCQEHPTRASEKLWSALPHTRSGGLFFDCEPDVGNPGHYRTLLDLVKNVDTVRIKLDGMFDDVQYCDVSNCMVTFKSNADAQRHARLCHDKVELTNYKN